jgi:hypothetical protein
MFDSPFILEILEYGKYIGVHRTFSKFIFLRKKPFSKYGYVGIVQDPTADPSTYLDYYSYVVNLGTRWLLGSYSLP